MKGRGLLGVAILAFVLRLGYAAATDALRQPQVWEQERIATNLVERGLFLYDRDGFNDRSYVEPLYPFLAAAVYLVTGHSQTVLVLLQLVIATGTVLVTAYATRLATGSHAAGVVAALMTSLHPGLIRYSSVLHPLVLDCFSMVAAAAGLLRYLQERTLRRGLVAAAVIGLGALTRPTILLFLVPLCLSALASRMKVRQRILQSVLLAVVAFALVAPWTIRNAIVHRTFMLTRSGAGFVFWLGHNPHSSGSAMDGSNVLILAKTPELWRQTAAADELTRDRLFREAAWKTIQADPAAAVGRVLLRIYYFWWFSPQWGSGLSSTVKGVYRMWWAGLLVLTAIGIFVSRFRRQRRDLYALAATAILISMGQSVFYVEGRHRLTVEPLLMPLAAVGVLTVSRRSWGEDE